MNLLDTDALSHLQKNDRVGAVISTRLAASADLDFRITVVNVFEMLGEAIELIRKVKSNQKGVVPGFKLLEELIDYLERWSGRIMPYDDAADQVYRGFSPRLRQELGNDARIAAIALVCNATVWTCDVDDCKRIPGLTVYAAETGMRVS